MKPRLTSVVPTCAAAAALFFALPGQAAFISGVATASGAGFSTNTTYGFTEAGLAAGTPVTNQYAGVTFSSGIYQDPQDCTGFSNTTNPCIGNFYQNSITGTFTIAFKNDQTQAGFNLITNSSADGEETVFEAYLDGVLVDSGQYATGAGPLNFFGFSGGSAFDTIKVVVTANNDAALLDNLTFDLRESPVPEPGSLALGGLALSALMLAARRRRPD